MRNELFLHYGLIITTGRMLAIRCQSVSLEYTVEEKHYVFGLQCDIEGYCEHHAIDIDARQELWAADQLCIECPRLRTQPLVRLDSLTSGRLKRPPKSQEEFQTIVFAEVLGISGRGIDDKRFIDQDRLKLYKTPWTIQPPQTFPTDSFS